MSTPHCGWARSHRFVEAQRDMDALPTAEWCPGPARTRAQALAAEDGQVLVLGVLFVALGLVAMLVVPGLAIGYAEHAGVQSAADASALACASQARITEYVDARGEIYQETVAVNKTLAAQAGAVVWGDNVAFWPVRTVFFAAVPAGAHCTVQVEVRSTLPVLQLVGSDARTLRFGTTAEARAYLTPS